MLMLFDRDESLISSLKYNNIQRKREINGSNTLEFETDKEVEFGQRLLFKDSQGIWYEYIIIDYFKTHDENGVTYEVYCEDSTSELYGFFIEDMKPRNETASNILGRILEGTRFEVGFVDDFGKASFNIYRTNCKAALWQILDKYQAEIKVRLIVGKQGIEHRYIDLRQSIGRDVGKRFTYKKDIGSIKKTTSTKDLVTALYGFGKGEEVVGDDGQPSGGYGRKIDFAEINGGKKYVTDEEARKKYGLGKERVHIFGSVDFDDCEDKEELLELTKVKLKELSKPKITYELNVEDISRYEGYIGEGVDLGDIVLVKDELIDTLVQTRVIAIKDNPIEEVNDSEIVLGNFIKDLSDNMVAYDKLKSVFENDRNRFNNELEKLAKGVKSSYIQGVLERFNKELNETGGWVYAEEGEGLLILNAPREGNPTQAINLKGGMIAIANHKNADGSFAYETFGDGNGFTANLIRAGILRGGKVFFNLEDGTFLIGESRTNYSMYWDGTTLHLRGVDIDLSNNYQIKNINKELNETNKKIDVVSQDFKVGQGKLESSINAKIEGVADIAQTNKDDLETYKQENAKVIGSVKSEIKQTESSIQSSVASQIKTVNNKIDSKDADVRNYVSNNYSTKTQTSSLIDSKVSSINSDVSGLRSRMSSAESSIRQTSSEISTKVSKNGVISSINQSSESIKINASKVDLQGDVNLTGRFKTYNGTKRALDMNGSSISMYDPNNQNQFMGRISASSTLTANGNFGYSRPVVEIAHDGSGLIIINKGQNLDNEREHYIVLDKNEHIAFHENYPIVMYQNTMVRGSLTVGDSFDSNRQNAIGRGTIEIGSWKLKAYYNTMTLYYEDQLVHKWIS